MFEHLLHKYIAQREKHLMFNFKAATIQRTDSPSERQRLLFSKSVLSLGIAMLGVVTTATASLGEQAQSSTGTPVNRSIDSG